MKKPIIVDTRQHIDSRAGKGARFYTDVCPTLSATCYKEPKMVMVTSETKSTYQDTWTKGESNGMKVNSFFCGAGGFDLGFIQAGFEITGAWDFDKYAIQSYNHNIGGAEQADVTMMKGEQLPNANGWLFGFPCQDISVAGKQAGMVKGETRSGLFYEIMRLLGEVSDKPEWILAENVKAVKKFIPIIEEEYDKAGYRLVQPQLYNSKFWWVPQNRERYFLLGIRKDLGKSFTFPEQQTDFIPKLSSILEQEVDEKYYIDDLKATKIIEQAMNGLKVKQATKTGYDIAVEVDAINISHPNSKTRRGRVGKQVAQTLLTGSEQVVVEGLQDVHACITPDRLSKSQNGRRAKPNEEEMFTLTAQDLHGVIQAEPKCVGMLDIKAHDHSRRVYDSRGEVVSPTLTAVQGGTHHIKILEDLQSVFVDKDGAAYCCDANYAKGISPDFVGTGRRTQIVEQITVSYNRKEGIEKEIDVAGALTSSDWRGLNQNQSKAAVVEIPQYRVRKLTPREYARLQGFPDSYEQVVSNSQFYKQMGNAVTVNVAHAIATAIKEQL